MVYPLTFAPIYKEMVWGGQRLARAYGRSLPFEHTGESWDVSVRPKEMSVISNGAYVNVPFGALLADGEARRKWLGVKFQPEAEFPLLIKLIDANSNLSVQVHPNDEQAQLYEHYPYGKSELWYVLEAKPGARLIIGLKDGVTREVFAKALHSGSPEAIEGCLSYLPIQRHDVINIPANLLHALTEGVMVAEIQQNCDITYRVYDYNRMGLDGKPRQLHVEKALNTLDFEGKLRKTATPGLAVPGSNARYYVASPKLCLITYELAGEPLQAQSDPDKFHIYTCAEGSCVFKSQAADVELAPGGSILIPATLGEYEIHSEGCKLLKSFVPDVEADFIGPLLKAGYTMPEIQAKTSLEL
jgi:mannose-6-phosphate isomerase